MSHRALGLISSHMIISSHMNQNSAIHKEDDTHIWEVSQMKKVVNSLLAVVMVASILTGCSSKNTYDKDVFIKTFYSSTMMFQSTYDGNGLITQAYLSVSFDDIVFVYSEADISEHDDRVVIAWPTENTVIILENLNRYTIRNAVDLTEFSLTYPITMEDVVERWELVNDYLSSIKIGLERILVPIHESE
jgi:outer membrane protein assembly factor BamE (lipoprotein component of BamABCDE complex)